MSIARCDLTKLDEHKKVFIRYGHRQAFQRRHTGKRFVDVSMKTFRFELINARDDDGDDDDVDNVFISFSLDSAFHTRVRRHWKP